MNKVFKILVVCSLLFLGASYEEILNDKNLQLEIVKKEIEDAGREIDANKDRADELDHQIDSVNTELEALNKFLKDFEDERFLTALEIAQEANIVLFLEEEVSRIQESFRNKIVNLYKHGKNYELELLLSAKTPNELLRRNEYLQKFAQNRVKELKELRTKKFILEEKKKLLSLSTSSQRYYVESKRNERSQLENKINELKNEKSELDEENKTNKFRIEQEEKERASITNFIKNFVENKNNFKGSKTSRINYPTQNFEELRGLMNVPVDVAVVKTEFGSLADNSTETIWFNNGIDFSVSKGSKVYCAANGVVDIVGEIPYYGKVVIVNHDNGYKTVYAVLEETSVKSGDIIKTSQLIGKSGENYDGQVFHFEIWKDRTSLNPKEWIKF